MLAATQPDLPTGEGWEYEPKWDGFRIVAHRSGAEVALVSRGARPMTRYFPEVLEAFRRLPADPVVLDGELVVPGPHGLDFDALQQRIHPAESRIALLSRLTPALYVAFDLLAEGQLDLRSLPLESRRARLERLLAGVGPPLHLTPHTREPELARRWFEKFEGAGLDGVIAKRWDQPYLPGKRAWVKVKHQRTADCIVIGFRWSSDRTAVGSLLLGLYDAEGTLHYVGHTSAFDAATRRWLLEQLMPLKTGLSPQMLGRMPGGPSRWSRGRGAEWEAVRPELVCEVTYDKLQAGARFRHAAGFVRWRHDKSPRECRFDQVAQAGHYELEAILGSDAGAGSP